MLDAWENGFTPAIQQAWYKPVRIDRQEFANRIDDQIIAEIQKARFLFADFTYGHTGVRGGIYFEAGFAKGLDLPIFITCRKDVFKNVHFDTRQFNHIVWQKPDELRNRVIQRIGVVIGRGPNQIPNWYRSIVSSIQTIDFFDRDVWDIFQFLDGLVRAVALWSSGRRIICRTIKFGNLYLIIYINICG